MERYSEYKDSGVKWLGEIPEHWEVLALKHILKSKKVLVGKHFSQYDLLSLTLKGVIKRDMDNPEGKFPASFDTYQAVEPNDFIFCNFDNEETPRAVGLSPHKGMITGAYDVLSRKNPKLTDKYLIYYFLYIDDAKRFKPLYKGLRKTIPFDSFMSYKIPVPSLKEQDGIVTYLDTATAQIDAAIAQQQKMIELLNERKQIIINNAVTRGLNPNAKMKDSGVEWIGRVPAHWEMKTLKRVFEKRIAGSWGEDESASAVNCVCLRIADFNYNALSFKIKDDYTIRSYSKEEIASKHLVKGEILLEKSGGGDKTPVGRCVVFDLDIETPMYANFMEKLVVRSFANHYYVVYLLSALYSNGVIWNYIKATTGIQNLDVASLLSKESICLPPIDEQKQIVVFLNEKTKNILDAIDLCNQQISLLQERKQIIINEVVTGKVKVSN